MRTHVAQAPAVLQRTCTCGRSAPAGGECEECKRAREQGETTLQRSPGPQLAAPPPASRNGSPGGDFSGVRVSRRTSAPRPRRLAIGPVDDAYEREADRVAGAVTASLATAATDPVAPVQRTSVRLQRQVDDEFDEEDLSYVDEDLDYEDVDEEDVEDLQAKPAGALPDHAPSAVEHYVGRLDQSGGAALPTGSRAALEPRLGHDLGGVRLHTDAAAASAARGVNARAFTVGRHIVFGAGQYAPESAAGQRLLTHELVHVVQQSGGAGRTIQRVPWGTCPPGTRLSGNRPDRYLAAEIAAWFYFKNQRRGHCIAQNNDDLAGLKCAQPEGRKLAEMFHSGKEARPQRPVMPAEDVPAPGADPSTLTGYVTDLAYRQLVPDLIDFTEHEFYDVTTEGMASAKRHKVAGYAKLATAITGKHWKAGTTLRPSVPTFPLHVGKPTRICYGSTDFDRRAGVISYEVIGTEEQKKKDKKEDEERKKKREEKKKRKEEAKKRKQEAKRKKKAEKKAKKEAKKKPKKEKKPKETKKPKEKKPKEKKPKEAKPGASAANIGFGISIGGGGGAGNAGVGVSIMSNGYAYGTVSAGVTYDSDGVAVGAVGAGASSSSTNVGAVTASAGLAQDTTSAGAVTAGAGRAKGSTSAGAVTAGAGTSEDDLTAAAVSAGKGESEGRVGAAAGTSGTVKKDDPQGKGGKPGGTQAEGVKDPGKEGAGKGGTEPGAKPGGTQKEGAKEPVKGPTGTGKGTTPGGEKGEPGKHGLSIPGLTPAQTDKAVEDAAAIEAMIRNARPTQRQLLTFLAQREGDQRYVVPAKTWVTTILTATNHVKDEDLLYLLELNWTPGQVTADQLKKDIDAAIKRKGAPPGAPADPQAKPGTKPAKPDKKPAKVDTPHAEAKKPVQKLGPPGPPGPDDKESKETEADYLKRLQKRAAEWKGWAGVGRGHLQIQYADTGKAQSMILFVKGEEKGKEILATCDLYGQPFAKGKKRMVRVTQSGPTVTADGRYGPPGKWNGVYTDMNPQ